MGGRWFRLEISFRFSRWERAQHRYCGAGKEGGRKMGTWRFRKGVRRVLFFLKEGEKLLPCLGRVPTSYFFRRRNIEKGAEEGCGGSGKEFYVKESCQRGFMVSCRVTTPA